MNLAEVYFRNLANNGNAVRAASQSTVTVAAGGSFQSILDSAGRTSTPSPEKPIGTKNRSIANDDYAKQPVDASRKQEDTKTRQETSPDKTKPSDDNSQNSTNTSPEDKKISETQTNKKNTTEKTGSSELTKPVDTEKKDNTVEGSNIDEQIVADIAKALGVDESAINQILAFLNISAPELVEPENMSLFVQKLYNAGSKADLLAIADVHETFKTLNAIVNMHRENAAPKSVAAVPLGGVMPEENMEMAENILKTDDIADKLLNKAIARRNIRKELANIAASNDNVKSVINDAVIKTVVANTTNKAILLNENIDLEVVDADAAVKAIIGEGAKIQLETAQVANKAEKQEAQTTIGLTNIDLPSGGAIEAEPIQQQSVTAATQQQKPFIINETNAPMADIPESNGFINPISQDAKPANIAETIATRAESLRNINTQDVINQIVERMKVEIKGDATTEIKITLKPEQLGDVTLKIAVQNGIVTAHFTAENQRIKEVIEAGFNNLREALQEQGVAVSQLFVSVGTDDPDRGASAYENSRNSRSSRRINRLLNAEGGSGDGEIQSNKPVPSGDTLVDYRV